MTNPNLTAKHAIEAAVNQIVANGHAANPDAYAATVRKDLRARYWNHLVDAAKANPNIEPTTLAADTIDEYTPTPGTAPTPNPTATIPTFEPEPWQPMADDDKTRAKARIAAIRDTLRGGDAA